MNSSESLSVYVRAGLCVFGLSGPPGLPAWPACSALPTWPACSALPASLVYVLLLLQRHMFHMPSADQDSLRLFSHMQHNSPGALPRSKTPYHVTAHLNEWMNYKQNENAA